MSIGLVLLIAVGVMILFGVLQRVLDRMRLTDRQAILFAALILIGGWIGDIPLGPRLQINLGGCVFPLSIAVYLLIRAGSGKERVRTLVAAALTAAAVYLVGMFFPDEPEAMPFDPTYLYGLIAGALAYIAGRTRRGAFVAAVLGVVAADLIQGLVNWSRGIDQTLRLGGAGAVDAVVISGIAAVLLSELTGEIIERLRRGAKRPEGVQFAEGEFRRKGEGE